MKKIFFLILISSLATTGLFAQKKVVPLPVDSAFAFGKEYVVYALPKTAFQVEVTLTLSHEFEGIYSQYAAELLNLPHVITQDGFVVAPKHKDVFLKMFENILLGGKVKISVCAGVVNAKHGGMVDLFICLFVDGRV